MSEFSVFKISPYLRIAISDKHVEWRYGGKTERYGRGEDWIAEKFTCRVCGKPLKLRIVAWALSHFQKETCGVECIRAETKARYACCNKAEPSNCVCMYSFKCPEHGETHIGTHD